MDFQFLSSLHPLVAVLYWDVLAGGIDANTLILASQVKVMGLDKSEVAGMLGGGNLEMLSSLEEICRQEIEDVRNEFHGNLPPGPP